MIKPISDKKGDIWVSAILYVLILSLSIVLIINVGGPIIDKMKDSQSLSKSKETMLTIDKTISEIANEGEGSQRIIPIEVKDGKMIIGNNEISWELNTKNDVLDERSNLQFGNMVISSNANVNSEETDDYYIMQTSINGDLFNVSIKKIGSVSNFSAIDTADLIESVYYKGQKLNGTFNFLVNGDAASGTGEGYTRMEPEGNNSGLGRSKVTAHINSTPYEYDLEITLESFADFLSIELKNVKTNP
jgi:hypothetical protein